MGRIIYQYQKIKIKIYKEFKKIHKLALIINTPIKNQAIHQI